ncbi:hypothetical protein HYQ46_000446 [Verticillium longisporum]|nr:hypothetical protein HYQ46_000446 [Verticillium longisporum]
MTRQGRPWDTERHWLRLYRTMRGLGCLGEHDGVGPGCARKGHPEEVGGAWGAKLGIDRGSGKMGAQGAG